MTIAPSATADRRSKQAGFSLVELTTTIAITGIMAVGLSNLLRHPMEGYAAVSRRTELVALGNVAINRMTRDLHGALPNSVRVSAAGDALELLLTSSGGRYRAEPGINGGGEDHSDDLDSLSFGGDASFNILGRFQNFPFAYGAPLPTGTRVAIYPTGAGIWAEAAQDLNPSSITPRNSVVRVVLDGDEDQIRLSADHSFSLESPSYRVYLVATPITYLCDGVDHSLWRVSNYNISTGQPTNRSATPLSGGSAARAADLMESCAFNYVPGTASRAGLITIELALTAGGERVRLLQQVQVQNAP